MISDEMTSNVFEAVLGRDNLKWDALWDFLSWRCDPAEGHGLQGAFGEALMEFAFGQSVSPSRLKREFRLEDAATPGGRWPDLVIGALDLAAPSHLIMMDDVDRTRLGDSRKLNNLRTYLERAHARFPSAVIRSVIL